MKVTTLKEKLYSQIETLNDTAALQLLYDAATEYTKAKKTDIIDMLSDEQVNRLNESMKQYNEGHTIPHSQAMQMLSQWRSK